MRPLRAILLLAAVALASIVAGASESAPDLATAAFVAGPLALVALAVPSDARLAAMVAAPFVVLALLAIAFASESGGLAYVGAGYIGYPLAAIVILIRLARALIRRTRR